MTRSPRAKKSPKIRQTLSLDQAVVDILKESAKRYPFNGNMSALIEFLIERDHEAPRFVVFMDEAESAEYQAFKKARTKQSEKLETVDHSLELAKSSGCAVNRAKSSTPIAAVIAIP
jgi:hypothetical protein